MIQRKKQKEASEDRNLIRPCWGHTGHLPLPSAGPEVAIQGESEQEDVILTSPAGSYPQAAPSGAMPSPMSVTLGL